MLSNSIRPKIPEIPGGERMERTFSGISFRNFGCTSRGCPSIPENRNKRKRLILVLQARSQLARPDPLPSGVLPAGMALRINSSQVSFAIRK